MEEREFVSWLKDEGLFQSVQDNFPFFKRILEENLGVTKNASLLIVGDRGTPGFRSPAMMMGCYMLAAKRLGYQYSVTFQLPKVKGTPACTSLIRAFGNLPPNSHITLSLSGKLGSLRTMGKSFRKYINHNNHRFLSTTGLSELSTDHFSKLVRSMNVDYTEMARKGEKLKRMLDSAKLVRIITAAGTNLKIDIEGMVAVMNSGFSDELGGNIPGGEVYIPPRKNHVEGTLVIDGSCKSLNSTILVKEPIKVFIESGLVKTIAGGAEAKALKNSLDEAEKKAQYPWGVRRVGELGIGLNPKAGIIGPTIINEKTLGTAHIAFGSNAWFGGTVYAITHLDQVFRDPKIWIDGKRIIIR